MNIVASIVVGALLALAVYFTEMTGCRARWADSGLRTSYSLTAGCRVQQSNGRWVPEDRVREVREWRGEPPVVLPPINN